MQIAHIKEKLKSASKAVILALHRLVFEKDGDRGNRQRLREFQGFQFSVDSEEFRNKLDYSVGLAIGDLILICNVLGLDYSGNKEQLRERIIVGLTDINSLAKTDDDEQEKDELEDDEDEGRAASGSEAGESAVNSVRDDASSVTDVDEIRIRGDYERMRFTLSYKDVEDFIKPFDGEDTYLVERFITDFEDAATMFSWSDLQKVVFAKKSLKGLAKLFIQSESSIKTWRKLKSALLDEFSTKNSSAQLHKKLESRKMKRDESVHEYFLTMKELAGRGMIKLEALFDYTIEGVNDNTNNKTVLFGAKTVKVFKEKLKVYDKIRKAAQEKVSKFEKRKEDVTRIPMDQKKTTSKEGTRMKTTTSGEVLRCFNCGGIGHLSQNCDKKELGRKCFNCNQFGHESSRCEEPRKSKYGTKSSAAVNLVKSSSRSGVHKGVTIENFKILALLDTGSPVTLVRDKIFNQLETRKLVKSTHSFTGFGKSKSTTFGYFQDIVFIDDEDYPLTLIVVPDDAMDDDVLIGRDILQFAELVVSGTGTIVKKKIPASFLAYIQVPEETIANIDQIPDVAVREKFKCLVRSYEPKRSKSTDVKLSITLSDEKPICQRPRRLSVREKEIVENQVKEWLDNNIIEPCSSDFASPVVVVQKKDGSPRVCIDYRPLNKVILKDKFPFPLIEDLLDKLKDALIFSTIDLKNGFFHVEVDEHSRKYTSFVTHDGQFQFLRTPFGLCKSPSVFQRFMNRIFQPLINAGVIAVYFDDLIILAQNYEEAVERLALVLNTASEYGLELNLKKCKFLKRRIEYLGHVVENGKVYPSSTKVQAVVRFPEPKCARDVQSFLGLTGYFRKFVESYSVIAKPLSDLLKRDKPYYFEENEKHAFMRLKTILTKEPVLKLFDPRHETEIHTDASQDGLGAILLQRSPEDYDFHPVHFWSRKTQGAEQNYKSYVTSRAKGEGRLDFWM